MTTSKILIHAQARNIDGWASMTACGIKVGFDSVVHPNAFAKVKSEGAKVCQKCEQAIRPTPSKLDEEAIRLAEDAQARADRATPGPWTTKKPGTRPQTGFPAGVAIGFVARGQGIYASPPGGSYPANDQDFMAAARTDVPLLAAHVKRLLLEKSTAAQELSHLRQENERQRALIDKAERGEYHSRTLCRAAGDSEGCEACAEIEAVTGRKP